MADIVALEQEIRTARTAAVIVNVQSRHGERDARRAVRVLRDAGYAVPDPEFVRNPAYLRGKVRAVVAAGQRYLILGGGDGSISSLVGELAYRDMVLGILPLGTGNSFALSLGIPVSLPGALDVLLHGTVATVDLGRVDDDYYANIVDIGLTAEMAWSTPRRLKRLLGKLAYLLVGIRIGWRHPSFHAHFIFDGQDEWVDTHEVIIANGRFYGDTLLDPEASLEDHRLMVYTMNAVRRGRLARLWMAFLTRRFTALPCRQCYYVSRLRIETDPPQYLDIDGENTRRTPAEFSVAPNALHVMVPAA